MVSLNSQKCFIFCKHAEWICYVTTSWKGAGSVSLFSKFCFRPSAGLLHAFLLLWDLWSRLLMCNSRLSSLHKWLVDALHMSHCDNAAVGGLFTDSCSSPVLPCTAIPREWQLPMAWDTCHIILNQQQTLYTFWLASLDCQTAEELCLFGSLLELVDPDLVGKLPSKNQYRGFHQEKLCSRWSPALSLGLLCSLFPQPLPFPGLHRWSMALPGAFLPCQGPIVWPQQAACHTHLYPIHCLCIALQVDLCKASGRLHAACHTAMQLTFHGWTPDLPKMLFIWCFYNLFWTTHKYIWLVSHLALL